MTAKRVSFTALVIALFVLGSCTSGTNRIAEYPSKNIKVVISHNVIAKDSIDPLVSTIVNVAVGSVVPGFLGVVAGAVAGSGTEFARREIGEEVPVTMLDKLDPDIYRHVQCLLGEKGYEVSLVGYHDWTSEDELPELDSVDDFYNYLYKNYSYDKKSFLVGEHDSILFLEYFVAFHDESVGEYLNELRVDYGGVRVFLAPKPGGDNLIYKDKFFTDTSLGRPRLDEFKRQTLRFRDWPTYDSLVIPSCNNRSFLRDAVDRELSTDSTKEDIEDFFAKYEIDFTHVRREQEYKGEFNPDNGPDVMDKKVDIVINYEYSSKTFLSAVVKNR